MTGIVLLGPPGVGKGTQAVRLREAMDLLHLSTGDALRQAVRDGTPVGRRVKSVMEAGELVSDELVGEVVASALASGLAARSGFLLDGFPRTSRQVEILDGLLAGPGWTLDHAVLLDAPEQVLLRRLTGRRVCQDCDAVYHVAWKPTVRENVCDGCGGVLRQRADDREETVLSRLRVYREQTEPVVSAYAARGLLRRVDASGDSSDVFDRLLHALGGVRA